MNNFIETLNITGANSVFFTIGVIGLVGLIIGIFLDDVLGGLGFEGFFSLSSISAFFGSFGFASMVALKTFNFSVFSSAIIGVVFGVLIFILFGGLIAKLSNDTENVVKSSATLVHSFGTVVEKISNNYIGAILTEGEKPQLYNASSVDGKTFDVGKKIVIVGIVHNNQVLVDSFD